MRVFFFFFNTQNRDVYNSFLTGEQSLFWSFKHQTISELLTLLEELPTVRQKGAMQLGVRDASKSTKCQEHKTDPHGMIAQSFYEVERDGFGSSC